MKNQNKPNIENYPAIIYGTSFLGNLYRELSEDEKLTLIKEWFRVSDDGVVMIDSAGKYGAGLALEVISWGLDKLGIEPNQIKISNKLGWYRVPLTTEEPTFEPGAWANLKYDAVQKISYDGILECWEQGCKLLGTYKPSLVSVHDPDEYLSAAKNEKDRQNRLNDILGAYKALFELKEKGEVESVGIGSKDWSIIKELYSHISFDWVMLANSFTLYDHPKEIIDFIEQLGQEKVTIINSAIFNAGFITGGEFFNYRKLDPKKESDQHLFEWRTRFFAICEKHNVEPGDACLKFALSPIQINSVALNPSKPKRMANNQLVLQKELPKYFWEALKKAGIIDVNFKYK